MSQGTAPLKTRWLVIFISLAGMALAVWALISTLRGTHSPNLIHGFTIFSVICLSVFFIERIVQIFKALISRREKIIPILFLMTAWLFICLCLIGSRIKVISGPLLLGIMSVLAICFFPIWAFAVYSENKHLGFGESEVPLEMNQKNVPSS